MKKILFILFVYTGMLAQGQKTYYVSPAGNDANPGTETAPWQTLKKVNAARLAEGDRVLLLGGETFAGSIEAKTSGVTYSSYGGGRAIIHSGQASGITLTAVENVRVSSLVFRGDGYRATPRDACGVLLRTGTARAHLRGVTIDSVECSGYRGPGLKVTSTSEWGYRGLQVRHSSFHDNGFAGIASEGKWATDRSVRAHVIRVANCDAYNNHGWHDYTENWSGSGIVLGGVDSTVIEYSRAWRNGAENAGASGGPIGIWLWDAANSTIRYSEAYENIASLGKDGGGFDLDGGCENTLIEYCKSWDNDGAGYGLYEWGSGWPYRNNAIRNCESRGDGRKNGYGALSLWSVDAAHQVTHTVVEGNTFYVTQGPAVKLFGSDFTGVAIKNNTFYMATADLPQVVGASPGVTFTGNVFQVVNLPVKPGSLKVVYDRATDTFTATFVAYATTGTQLFTLEYSRDGVTWIPLRSLTPERLEAEKTYTLTFKIHQ